jgi:hypothetical protein
VLFLVISKFGDFFADHRGQISQNGIERHRGCFWARRDQSISEKRLSDVGKMEFCPENKQKTNESAKIFDGLVKILPYTQDARAFTGWLFFFSLWVNG